MRLSQEDFLFNVSEIKKSNENKNLILILENKIADYQEQLEDLLLDEKQTNAIRGRVLEIRELIDLFSESS